MSNPLRITREDGVAVLTLDRPARRNALDEPLWDALRAIAVTLSDEIPRAVIVTGGAEHFCAGMDLSDDNTLLQRIHPLVLKRDTHRLAEVIVGLKKVFGAIARIPAPVVMAIEGVCLGGGLELALAGDLRIASETSRFSLPETQFGMVPDVGGTVRLSKLVGRSRATDLILTGRTLDAATALEWGLVNELVAPGSTLDRAHEVVERIRKASPAATRQALLALRAVDGLHDGDRFDLETEAGARTLVSGHVLEGLAAFSDKREPVW